MNRGESIILHLALTTIYIFLFLIILRIFR